MSNVTEPVILPLPTPPPWDPESAARRIAQLETALMRRHELLEQKQAGWRNAAHREQWRTTLSAYVFPKIGDLAVSAIDTGLVVQVPPFVNEGDKLRIDTAEGAYLSRA